MSKQYQIELVVFDMAGTTVDEDNVVYKTVRDAINQHGYSFDLPQVLEVGAGKEKSMAIRDVLALDGQPHTDEEVATIFGEFRQLLSSAYQSLEVKEQPGASAAFRRLRDQGIKVVLNTGYDRATAESLVNQIGWRVGEDIDGLVTASDVEIGRPGPEMIHVAMNMTGVHDSQRAAKVGDSMIDIEEGRNAECGLTVGITTGAQTRPQLQQAQPDEIVDSLEALVGLVCG